MFELGDKRPVPGEDGQSSRSGRSTRSKTLCHSTRRAQETASSTSVRVHHSYLRRQIIMLSILNTDVLV